MAKMVDLIKKARTELKSITGSDVERVCGFEPLADGWQMQMEVVELSRTPNTQDLLALYDVQLDSEGSVLGFDRIAHRTRGGAYPEDGS
jgi:hypothetical protein